MGSLWVKPNGYGKNIQHYSQCGRDICMLVYLTTPKRL